MPEDFATHILPGLLLAVLSEQTTAANPDPSTITPLHTASPPNPGTVG